MRRRANRRGQIRSGSSIVTINLDGDYAEAAGGVLYCWMQLTPQHGAWIYYDVLFPGKKMDPSIGLMMTEHGLDDAVGYLLNEYKISHPNDMEIVR